MKVKYDEEELELTPRFYDALVEAMCAECEMMAKAKSHNADCWTWGRCEISDLAASNGIAFYFGGEEDQPDDGLGDFAVKKKKGKGND